MAVNHKLAAIMFTDIQGYTALMGKDEEKALSILRKSRQIQKSHILALKGKWIKEMGDGVLAQFESARDAVKCAIAIQQQANNELEALLRIGIHLGDVTIENEDVFGDGVNLASRLQDSADPGGIYISDSVQKAIRAIADIQTVFLGEFEFKNVDYPVRTYAIQGNYLPGPSNEAIKRLSSKSKNENFFEPPATPYSELVKVNCNRKKILKRFWRSFDLIEENGEQVFFYFLAAQQYGQAISMLKRLITNLKWGRPGVKYDGFYNIKPLEIDLTDEETTEDCIYEIKKAFNRGLYPQVNSLEDFVSKIEKCYPQYNPYTYLPFAFKLDIYLDCWKPYASKAMDYFIKDFCSLNIKTTKNFVFFFIINIQNKNFFNSRKALFYRFFNKRTISPKVLDIHQELQLFTKGRELQLTLLPLLRMVTLEDLEDWYKQFEDNQRLREKLVDDLVRKLGKGSKWDMSAVERELAFIVEKIQNSRYGMN